MSCHLVYGLIHPAVPDMGVLYVGSTELSREREEEHRAGKTTVVSRGCVKFGLDPSLLETHVLEFWTKGSPENAWIARLRKAGQAEFNKRAPYAFSLEDTRRGGRKGGQAGALTTNTKRLGGFATMTFKQRQDLGKKYGRLGGLVGGFATMTPKQRRENSLLSAAKKTPEQRQKGGLACTQEQHQKAGHYGGHSRWHVARGVVNPKCKLCQGETHAA